MDETKAIHFVGIGGVGMSALAQVMLEAGHRVSGSDLKLSPVTDRLAAAGARVLEGHAPHHLGAGAQLVVVSSAVPASNPELQEAQRRGLPIIKRAALLGDLMAQKEGIAVAGTHGKTTTASMIALILERTGYDPTILVGGELVDLGLGAKLGQGRYLVAEADEFDAGLSHLRPKIAVVTNVEAEHLDAFGSYEGVLRAFGEFLASLSAEAEAVVCADDPGLKRIIVGEPGVGPFPVAARLHTYGFTPGATWRAQEVRANQAGGSDFVALHQGRPQGPFRLAIPGVHNVLNALAAIAVSSLVGLDLKAVRRVLADFHGARRRFEVLGEVGGVTIVDDYGHHPTEIRATLRAARDRFGPRRLVVVFQPHLYSRTRYFLGEFAISFGEADEVILADIYAAREADTLGISSAHLAAAMARVHPCVRYLGSLEDIILYLRDHLEEGGVLFTMGAGDVDRVARALVGKG